MRLAAAMLVLAMAVAACHDGYDADVDPGPNGEPGSALKHVYSKQFRVAKADYFTALGEFYSFADTQVFEKIDFGDCFNVVLDFVSNERAAPCIGMFAAKGAPTKAHMTFMIVARSFNRLDRNDHLICRVDLYINEGYQPVRTLASLLTERVDGKLQELDRRVDVGPDRKH
jgi:hypothetical protein